MAWLNLTMSNQAVKNGLKAKKFKLPKMNFLEKQLTKSSCTYWPLSFCKILKKFLGLIQSYEDVPFSGPKWPICHEQFFWVQIIIITFSYLLAFFIVQNVKKILTVNPELQECVIFGPQMVQLPQTESFFEKNYEYHFHLPIGPFHSAKFLKNSSNGSRVMRCTIFGPKMAHFPK